MGHWPSTNRIARKFFEALQLDSLPIPRLVLDPILCHLSDRWT